MSFWDNVKKFAQPYSDEEYDDYDEEPQDDYEEEAEKPASRTSRRTNTGFNTTSSDSGLDFGSASTASSSSGFGGQVINMSSGRQEVVLFHAKAFDDAAKASDELRNKKAVILNMENVDKGLTRRVVDFLSGCVYALDGKVKKVAQSTYLFCPHSMDISGDLEGIQAEMDSYV